MTQATTIKVYNTVYSGHGHKVELFLTLLGLAFEHIHTDQTVRQSEAFKALNPLQQIPVLVDGEQVIADSNAILVYLAKRYAPNSHWLPEEAVAAAEVQRWLSVAAGELKYGPANARAVLQWNIDADPDHAQLIAHRLLASMQQHLASRQWLATDQITIADLSCYSYVAHAPEGGIDLQPYPAVLQWIQRVEAIPGFFPMPALANKV